MSEEKRTLVVRGDCEWPLLDGKVWPGSTAMIDGLAPGTYEVTLTKREEPVRWDRVQTKAFWTEGGEDLNAYTALIEGADGVTRRAWVIRVSGAYAKWRLVGDGWGLSGGAATLEEAKAEAEERWRSIGGGE